MNAKEIAAAIKAESPKMVEGFTEEAVERVVRGALAQISKAIEAQESGPIAVAGLGRFVVKMAEAKGEAGGEKIRKISFKAAPEVTDAKREERKAARKQAA
jgi:nucleoid DNA-binding protein